MMIKIALTGKMRTGKDYLAEAMRPDLRIYRLAFGDDLKYHAKAIFPQHFEGNAKPRKLIQTFGQMMRQLDSDVWVRPVIGEIQRIERVFEAIRGQEKTVFIDGVIVTDLRQPNEFVALRDAGFTIIRVTAPQGVRYARMKRNGDAFDPADLAHETESHIDGFDVDYEILNDGTHNAVAELREIIRKEYGV